MENRGGKRTGHFRDIFCGPATISSSSDAAAFTGKVSDCVTGCAEELTLLMDLFARFVSAPFELSHQGVDRGGLDEHNHKIEFLY